MIPCRRKTASSGSLSLSPATDSFQLWGLSIAKTLSLFTCNKSVCYSIFETGCSHLLLTGAYAVYAYVPLSIPPTVVLNVMLSVNELSLLWYLEHTCSDTVVMFIHLWRLFTCRLHLFSPIVDGYISVSLLIRYLFCPTGSVRRWCLSYGVRLTHLILLDSSSGDFTLCNGIQILVWPHVPFGPSRCIICAVFCWSGACLSCMCSWCIGSTTDWLLNFKLYSLCFCCRIV